MRQAERIGQALFLTAAMTGLRQGELIALRWRDGLCNGAQARCTRAAVDPYSERFQAVVSGRKPRF